MKKSLFLCFLVVLLIVMGGCNSKEKPSEELKEITGLSLVDEEFLYDGTTHSLEVVGDLPEGTKVVYQNNNKVDVGIYEVVATVSGKGYKTLELKASLAIKGRVISGISFTDKTVMYDGTTHSLEVVGDLPEGTKAVYQNNNKVDVGIYEVVATVSGKGYKTLELKASLAIKGRVISGVSFTDKTVMYDGTVHLLEVSGQIPEGVSVTYSSNKDGITNATSEVGEYIVTANLTGKGYQPLTLTAKLTISETGKKVFSGITFENKSVVYDGQEHEIIISGSVPDGTLVTYSSTTSGIENKATEVGVYHVTVVLSKEGYETLTLQAVLEITSSELKQFTGIKFTNKTEYYNASEHEIVISGTLPEGTSVVYSSNDTPNHNNKAIEAGKYSVKVTISKSGYETLELNAILHIKPEDKEWFITSKDGIIYFNNGLHKDYLYKYEGGEIVRVNYDYAKYFAIHNNNILYVSDSLLFPSIKSYNGTSSEIVISKNAKYLVTDGTHIYFVVNALTNEKSGIFKLNPSDSEAEAVKIFTGKSKHLTLVGNDLYFANGSDDYKLYKINKTSISATATKVVDEKIKELTYDSGSLYFTVNHLMGDYLARFNISTNVVNKLTSDNARFITVIGDYVYYSNHDVINTQLFGKGLYRVLKTKDGNSNLPGEKLYETDYNVSSLYALDHNTILFYRVSDSHLMRYNILNKTVEDLMEGYIPPEDTSTQLNPKTESFVWNNRVYYINNSLDGVLYYYDTKLEENYKVTSNMVKSFSIIGDVLYFNSISWLVNNDLYMVNLKTGGDPILISKNDARDVVIHNDNLYYVKGNMTGVGTAIVRLSLSDLSVEEEVYSYNVHNLTVHNNKLYFIKGAGVDEIWCADIESSGSLSNIQRIGNKKTDWFVIAGDKMYYREVVGLVYKHLSYMNLDGTGDTQLIKSIDPVSFILKDGYIYYTNETTSSAKKNGIYKVKIDGSQEELLYESVNGDGLGIEMHIVNDYLYYYSKSTKRFYRLNLTTKVVEVLDRL